MNATDAVIFNLFKLHFSNLPLDLKWIRKLHVWEHATPKFQRYAYHVSKGTQLVIRWDNAPHHRQVNTFPHHKHVKEDILASKEMSIEDILEELEKMIQRESS